jgi:hypothetical protein
MLRLRDYLVDHVDDVSDTISKDVGKTRVEALATEVLPSAMATDYYAKNAWRFLQPRKVRAGSLLFLNKRSRIFRIPFGVIGIIAPYRNWKRFEVRTPLAIASVRSTEWLVEHRADSGTAVFARKGGVDVASGREVHRLASGDGITITDTGEPPRVKQWSLERIARSGQALGFGWK